jgi:subfamily B ATP-binding cassette protein MsbA
MLMSDAQTPKPSAPPAIPKASLKDSDNLTMFRRLFVEHGRKHLASYVFAIALMSVGAGATAYSAYLLKPVLNGLIEGERFKELRMMAWIVFGLFALRGISTYCASVIMSRAGNAIIAAAQSRLFNHLLRQDMRFYNGRHSTDFITRLVYAPNGVRDTIQALITSIGRDVLTLAGLAVVMFLQDPQLALIAVSVVPAAAFILSRTVGRMRKFIRRTYAGATQIMETMQETVQGARIVKSFNLEETMRTRMALNIREVEKSSNRVAAGLAISSPVADTLAGLAIGAVIFYGSYRVTIEQADAGSFFSFVAAMLMAYDPARRLARLRLDVQNGLTSARLMYEVLDAPAAEAQVEGLPKLDVAHGRIVVENVDFRYRPDEAVLAGFNLVVKPNQTTALVGPSGGGKSTIIALLQRFYAPESGRILIDGADIAQVDLHSLRAKIAFVSQDVFLFNGSIRDNIALGRPGAGDEEIFAAARKAHAHDFICGFSTGYETSVGEQGAQLSGGQKQRIAIARAILKDAPILLLDEPTAALDSESEREVQKALDELRIGRTTLVVAHRLQTIINADTIVVIEGGRAAEAGSHEQLMALGGVYRTFFASQFGDSVETFKEPASARP